MVSNAQIDRLYKACLNSSRPGEAFAAFLQEQRRPGEAVGPVTLPLMLFKDALIDERVADPRRTCVRPLKHEIDVMLIAYKQGGARQDLQRFFDDTFGDGIVTGFSEPNASKFKITIDLVALEKLRSHTQPNNVTIQLCRH